jgi:hypothetical protein
MILVVRQAFVNLGPRQIGKTPHDIVNAGTIDDQANHVMHPYPSAVYNRVSSADTGQIYQVTVTSRWHGINRKRDSGPSKADFRVSCVAARTPKGSGANFIKCMFFTG